MGDELLKRAAVYVEKDTSYLMSTLTGEDVARAWSDGYRAAIADAAKAIQTELVDSDFCGSDTETLEAAIGVVKELAPPN